MSKEEILEKIADINIINSGTDYERSSATVNPYKLAEFLAELLKSK